MRNVENGQTRLRLFIGYAVITTAPVLNLIALVVSGEVKFLLGFCLSMAIGLWLIYPNGYCRGV